VVATRGGGLLLARPSMANGGALRLAQSLSAAAGGAKGVLLDLRSHTGGLLDEAVAVAAAFLRPADVVLRQQGRAGETVLRADRGDHWRAVEEVQRASAALKSIPLVVLVDEHTASGAELAAAALQANKRATVVGRPTRGIGTVATLRPIGNWSWEHLLKVTSSRMLAPDGRRIEGQGVAPDVRVDGEEEAQYLKAAERALAGAGR
jgi:carboxyl-terminal processing protease